MNNFENLSERVENAVHKFHQSEKLRRSENKSLSRILNELEIKFEARTAELEDCQTRIGELEESNVSLSALVCQLVDLVEKSADEIAKDPLYRASAAASDIVERYVAEAPANDDAGTSVAPAAAEHAPDHASEPDPAPALEQGPPAAPAGAALAGGRFEDIEDEFLLAEDLLAKTDGASDFPKLVYDAMATARGEDVPAAPAEAPADIPVPEAASATGDADGAAPGDGDLDIKEIMARLEIAAERAQLRADEEAKRDRGEVDPEVLDRAVGGRA